MQGTAFGLGPRLLQHVTQMGPRLLQHVTQLETWRSWSFGVAYNGQQWASLQWVYDYIRFCCGMAALSWRRVLVLASGFKHLLTINSLKSGYHTQPPCDLTWQIPRGRDMHGVSCPLGILHCTISSCNTRCAAQHEE